MEIKKIIFSFKHFFAYSKNLVYIFCENSTQI